MKAMILGNALDTNGQNARYAEASRKHGESDAILKALAIGNYDPAGVAERFRVASQKSEGLEIRAAHRTRAYFDFPTDLTWGRDAPRAERAEVERLARRADVIHLNNDVIAVHKLQLGKKPMLLHHHGTLFRHNPERLLATAKTMRMVQAVSTVDLMRFSPDVQWLPTAYDVSALQAMRVRRDDGRVRIVHAPTNREGKHTGLFLEAVRQLQEEGLPLDLDLIENVTNAECLARKAEADILYDQLAWGYGCNAVEAWGMGIPVIAGADPWTIAKMRDMWGVLPFSMATETTLKKVIRDMVLSEDVRAAAASRGLNHVLRYHDELPALERLVELYHKAIAAKARPRIEGKGVEFRTKRQRSRLMHVDGQPVQFVDGVVTVTDVEVANRLRRMARDRPSFGIEEVA